LDPLGIRCVTYLFGEDIFQSHQYLTAKPFLALSTSQIFQASSNKLNACFTIAAIDQRLHKAKSLNPPSTPLGKFGQA
jgi:hypothetical protein